MNVFGLDIATDWREIRYRAGRLPAGEHPRSRPDGRAEPAAVRPLFRYGQGRTRAQRAEELLEFFALTNKRDAKVMELSGGMARDACSWRAR
jgi:ABC-type multidrug transport system ATPase subunit